MPKYDYRCQTCKKRFEVFIPYADYGIQPVHCPNCGTSEVSRLINRVRFARSEDSRLDDMADPDQLAGLEDDPRAMGRMLRKMSKEAGEDMPPEFDEVVDRLEKGQDPEQIEQDLPGLMDDSSSEDMAF